MIQRALHLVRVHAILMNQSMQMRMIYPVLRYMSVTMELVSAQIDNGKRQMIVCIVASLAFYAFFEAADGKWATVSMFNEVNNEIWN